MAKEVVCVTGASGYIASWLVKLLLHRGYTVKGTVRNLSDPRKVEHLNALEGADERLHLYEADLINEGSFDSVVEGCDGVFHTAAHVSFSASDPQEEMIGPSVKGTLNVLRSCKKVPSVKRVVITSSMASVAINGVSLTPDVTIDETWFSDPDLCERTKNWYPLAKTLAEKAAWEFAQEQGIDMVTLHPGLVIGPLLQPTLNLSSQVLLSLIKEGKDLSPDGTLRFIDVRDVALAHVLALENPSANGRYCLVAEVIHSSDALGLINQNFPSLNLQKMAMEKLAKRPEALYKVSKERAQTLGINFTPLEDSLKDSVQSLKDRKFLHF